jgi:uncharacterized phage protein gp47/JayE
MPLTPEGYDAKRAAEWLTQIRNEYEERTGESIDFERDQFVSQVTAIMADKLAELSQSAQSLYDVFDPQSAEGVYLDVLASLVGIERREATQSSLDITLLGDDTTVVPRGSEIEDAQGRRWRLTEDEAIGSAGPGKAEGSFLAVEEGPKSLQANAFDTRNDNGRIVTPVSGWDDAYNAVDAVPGRERETDAELRQRRRESLQIVGAASMPAIRGRLEEDVDDVVAARIVDNPTGDQTVTQSGEPAPPHGVVAYVYPDPNDPDAPNIEASTADYRTAIAQMLARTTAAGVQTGVDSTVDPSIEVETVTLSDGYDKDFRWYWVESTLIDVEVSSIETERGYSQSDLEDDIKDAIEAFFDGLDIGDDVDQLPALGELSTVEGLTKADVRFATAGNPLDETSVTIAFNSYAALNSTTVV